jgi:TDG/mug DNA glycosylase family protein
MNLKKLFGPLWLSSVSHITCIVPSTSTNILSRTAHNPWKIESSINWFKTMGFITRSQRRCLAVTKGCEDVRSGDAQVTTADSDILPLSNGKRNNGNISVVTPPRDEQERFRRTTSRYFDASAKRRSGRMGSDGLASSSVYNLKDSPKLALAFVSAPSTPVKSSNLGTSATRLPASDSELFGMNKKDKGVAALFAKRNADALSNGSFKKKKKTASVDRTKSFGALYTNSPQLQHWCNQTSSSAELSVAVPVHTLVVGTHPSIVSLAESQYFGHSQNAFWWIAGDCLGFRRASGISESTGKTFKLCDDVRYGTDRILNYQDQVLCFSGKGMALWDVVASCHRPGSLDQDISNAKPNEIKHFVCEQFPSVKRIVLANGGTGCKMFLKLFKEWWNDENGDVILVPGENPESLAAFSKYAGRRDKYLDGGSNNDSDEGGKRVVECISALAVSPAAAKYSYKEKRDHWEKHVYQPAMKDYENWIFTNEGAI